MQYHLMHIMYCLIRNLVFQKKKQNEKKEANIFEIKLN